jgi:predicted extracellular nuclease
MNKNFVAGVLFLTMIIGAAFAGNVSAQTGKHFTTGKVGVVYAPQVSPNVVINEIYGGSELSGNVYNADFIELYNPSSTPVNISDYSVQYYTAGQINGGAPTSTAHIPDGTVIQPFSFYVIRVSPIRATGASFACAALDASASFAGTGIEADGGKLVLTTTGANLANCTSALNVIDRVGYGTEPAEPCNESFNANQPSAASSVQRRSGRADSDNNSLDFTAFSAPTPCTQILAPTAATVMLAGRILTLDGRGLTNVRLSLTDSQGNTRTTSTETGGYYRFEDVQVGETYILSASGKRYTFSQPLQVLNINEEANEVNFIANSEKKLRSF